MTAEHEATVRSSLVALAVGVATCWISGTAHAQTGPSFKCPKPNNPLAELICSSPDLSQIDLWYVQAYQALRAQLDPGGQKKLLQEADAFDRTVRSQCGIGAPDSGKTASPSAIPCVQRLFMAQRDLLAGRLTGAAAEEAAPPLQAHVALQADLKRLGFLPPEAAVYGVFGPITRKAIHQWQESRSRRLTGFLDNSDGALLEEQAASLQAEKAGTPAASSPVAAPPKKGPFGELVEGFKAGYRQGRRGDEAEPTAESALANTAPAKDDTEAQKKLLAALRAGVAAEAARAPSVWAFAKNAELLDKGSYFAVRAQMKLNKIEPEVKARQALEKAARAKAEQAAKAVKTAKSDAKIKAMAQAETAAQAADEATADRQWWEDQQARTEARLQKYLAEYAEKVLTKEKEAAAKWEARQSKNQ